MPLVLPPERWAEWLDPAREDVTELADPTPPQYVERLEIRPVGAAVGNAMFGGVTSMYVSVPLAAGLRTVCAMYVANNDVPGANSLLPEAQASIHVVRLP